MTKDVNPNNGLATHQLKPPCYFISESPGPAVPDSAYSVGMHQLNMGVPWSPRLHPAIGEASAPCRAPTDPFGLAVQAKGSLFGGGSPSRSAGQGPGNSNQ